MRGKYFQLILLKFLFLVGVVRSWSTTNYSNHNLANVDSSSKHNTLLMMNDLCELPLDQLLKVKKSLRELHLSDNDQESPFNKVESRLFDRELDVTLNEDRVNSNNLARSSNAMNAIVNHHRPFINRKSGYGSYGSSGGGVSHSSEKSSKIQSIFQISITALAFLAFAGYLLCMIVQAIKSKGTMYAMVYPNANLINNMPGTLNSQTNTGSVPLRKRRPIGRRKRRNIVASSLNNSTLNSIDFDDSSIMLLPSSLEMYDVFIYCAEDYTKFYK